MKSESTDRCVSVVIPTRNRANFIGLALESVFAQTALPGEVIVVDDGSQDATEQAIRPWRDRIRYLPRPQRGVSAARNFGIHQAQGGWIAFLDSDDAWEPRALERLLDTARKHPQAGVVSMRGRWLYPDGRLSEKSFGKKSPGPYVSSASLLRGDAFALLTPMVRRGLLLESGGFDETLVSAEDCDLWLRLSFVTTLVVVPEALLRVRLHGDNTSRDKETNARMWLRILDKLRQERPEFVARHRSIYRRARGKELLRLGRELLASGGTVPGALEEARGALSASIRAYPWFFRTWTYLAASYLAPRRYAAWRRLEMERRHHR